MTSCVLWIKKAVILVLSDFSAILISRLSTHFGVKGTVLAWFKSFLTSPKQFVKIEEDMSSKRPLLRGVPQGSVLGPPLYLVYTAPNADIIKKHNLLYICTLMTRNCIYPSILIAVLIFGEASYSCVLNAVLEKLTFGCVIALSLKLN